ncbi:LysE family translocator [Actinoalloteichus caeruleus]|uniref:LysE family translocator n=1 Tax=Actinoalloteichus cyanogriseus TaxID=2893586 RepID=UPI003BB86FF9
MGAEWTGFLTAAFLVSLVPGANQLLGMRNAIHHGIAPAVVAATGRLVAFVLMIVAVAFGAGALITSSDLAYTVLTWCGVAYLGWLGLSTLWRARREGMGAAPAPDAEARPSRWRLARREFLVAATNPKALLLFTAFLPQFVDQSSGSATARLLALGAGYLVVEFVVMLLYATAGARIGAIARPGAMRRVDQGTGVVFLGLAGWLAASSR